MVVHFLFASLAQFDGLVWACRHGAGPPPPVRRLRFRPALCPAGPCSALRALRSGLLRYAARSSVPLAPPPFLRRPGFRRGSLSSARAARRRVSRPLAVVVGGSFSPPASPSAVWWSLWLGGGGGSPLGACPGACSGLVPRRLPKRRRVRGSRPAAVWSWLSVPAPITPSVPPLYSSRTPAFRRRASSRRRRSA